MRVAELVQNGFFPESRVIPEMAFINDGFLIVSWNSVDFLDGGDGSAQLAGNAPFKVDLNTGECSDCPFEEVVDFLRRGLFPED